MSKIATELISLPGDSTAESADGGRRLELFSLLVHDLESPIASMKYLLKLMDEGRFDAAKPLHQRIVHSSRIAVERAESVLFDVMAVARAGSVGMPVHLTKVALGEIIGEAVEMVQGSALENGVSITSVPVDAAIFARADVALLRRVLDNLLYNALRHTPNGGRITVTVERAIDSLQVHITDSGPGLGDVDPEYLFSKYGQVQLRAEGKHRGVGLGLHFCRLALDGMGGGISAHTHPRGGAVFTATVREWGE